jgi:lipopolysaccharide/colanic/teichoic acid biosynthesis glycosyltransferase
MERTIDIVIGPEGAARPLLDASEERSLSLAAKRAIDVVASAVLLVLLAPLMLVVAALVVATSRGPVLFRQYRVGQDGELFALLKFRTMAADTTARLATDPELRRVYEANDFKLPAGAGDVTRLGRVLRATSIDELPQLWLVLRGRMSMVGVRPMEPAQLAKRTPYEQATYTAMRPGLTGLWQVSGRSTLPWAERCRLDADYVENWTVASDVSIALRTPFALLRFRETV